MWMNKKLFQYLLAFLHLFIPVYLYLFQSISLVYDNKGGWQPVRKHYCSHEHFPHCLNQVTVLQRQHTVWYLVGGTNLNGVRAASEADIIFHLYQPIIKEQQVVKMMRLTLV